MNSPRTPNLLLPPDLAGRIDPICNSFDTAWQAGGSPRLEEFLGQGEEADRPALFRQLLDLELYHRLRRGDCPLAEEYRLRLPEYRSAIDDVFAGLDLTVSQTLGESTGGGSEGPTVVTPGSSPRSRPKVAGYEILEELGHGGMGVVYKARHVELDRIVALKMILSGRHAHDREMVRFQTEARAIARLQHPNIVQVHEVGEHEGKPYLCLEFCSGGSLDKKLKGTPLPPAEAAHVVELLAQAMQAAHEKNVIHRDLKPANVLLSEDGTPKLTDFGLAKKLDEDSGQTRTGTILGTPSYMAPEQADGKDQKVGPAADVYALGAILYELLTGRPPFKAATPLETLVQVANNDPVPLTQLQPKTPRDLETICLKCLQKAPAKRYGSARELAEDLRRFQAREPIAARPVTAWERVGKWARRQPAMAALIAVSLAAAATLLGGGAWFTARLQQENAKVKQLAAHLQISLDDLKAEEAKRLQAEQERQQIADARYPDRIQLAYDAWSKNQPRLSRSLLDDCRPGLRGWEWDYLSRLCPVPQAYPGHQRVIATVAVSPDGRLLASGGDDKSVRVWDAATGQPVHTLLGHRCYVMSLVFSPDGKKLVSGGGHAWTRDPGELKFWDLATGKELPGPREPVSPVRSLVFSPTQPHLLASANGPNNGFGDVKLWDLRSGKLLRTLGPTGSPWCVSFTADGRRLVSGGADRTVRVWDPESGQQLSSFTFLQKVVRVGCSPKDPDLLAVTTGEAEQQTAPGELVLCDLGSDKKTVLWRFTQPILTLAFRPDGKELAAASGSFTVASDVGPIWFWDTASRQLTGALRGHIGAARDLAFSPDGRWFFTAGGTRAEGVLLRWRPLAESQPFRQLQGHRGRVCRAAFSPDGHTLATGGADGLVKLWDPVTGAERRTLQGDKGQGVVALAFSGDGSWLASGTRNNNDLKQPGEIILWEVSSGRRLFQREARAGAIYDLALAPDGRTLAVAGEDRAVTLWDTQTATVRQVLKGHRSWLSSVAFAPDGKRLASATGLPNGPFFKPGDTGEVKVWDAVTGQVLLALAPSEKGVSGLAFAPDGKTLALSLRDGTIRLWDLTAERERLCLRGHTGSPLTVAFAPDGRRLVSGSDDSRVKVWDVSNGQPLLTLQGHTAPVCSVCFSPDGKRFVTTSWDNTVKVWDTQTGREPRLPETSQEN